MSFRPYDNNRDDFYSPDLTPDLYLLEETVLGVLSEIPSRSEEEEIEVRDLIIRIETLNRKEKLGSISIEECFAQNKIIAEDFLRKYGIFPYVAKTYEQFYDSFSRRTG
jgi:hypothetical protein